jgi:hypothetical protein
MKIFISYAREDINIAQKLYADLKNQGIAPWIDIEDILPGQKWKHVIKTTIQESKYVIILLSNNSVSKKGYIQKEVKYALDILEEYPDSETFIIPVRLDNCKPSHYQLIELHWTDLFPSYEEGKNRIIHFIKKTNGKPFEKDRKYKFYLRFKNTIAITLLGVMVIFICVGYIISSNHKNTDKKHKYTDTSLNNGSTSLSRKIARLEIVDIEIEDCRRFKLSEKDLVNLEYKDVPDEIILRLKPLENKELKQTDFLVAVVQLIGEQQAEKYIDSMIEFADTFWKSGRETLLDIKLLNTGNQTALLTRIEIKVLEGNEELCTPHLEPSGEYFFDISKGIATKHVSHSIAMDQAERIKLYLFHGCWCCTDTSIRLTLFYNEKSVSKTLSSIKAQIEFNNRFKNFIKR